MRAFTDAARWLWEIDAVTLAWAARRTGADPTTILELRRRWLATATYGADGGLPDALRTLTERIGNEALAVEEYQRHRGQKTEALPLGPRPTPSAVANCGLWPDEQAEFDAILAVDYAAIDGQMIGTFLDIAPEFLPPEVIRYFAPAVAEHAGDFGDGYLMEMVVASLAKALPLPPHLADGLRRAVRARTDRPYFGLGPPGDWQKVRGDGPGFAKLLLLVAELDPDALTRALFASCDPLVAFSVIEHDHAVTTAGWRPANPAAADLYADEAITRRLQGLERSSDPEVALLASQVLETRLAAGQ